MHPLKRGAPLALVVDDDDTMRVMVSEVLAQFGIAVEEAADGESGLERFHALRPDIVILDVKMPRMDGFAVCRHLRALPEGQHTPVLMMTAAEDTTAIERAFDAGATDFVRKPFHWSILGHRVRYVLRAAEALQNLARSEAQLANAQRLARLGSWDWYVDIDELRLSESARRILAHTHGCVPSGLQGLIGLFHADDREPIEKAVRAALHHGPALDLECRVPLPEGGERIVQQRAEALHEEGGRVVQVHGVLQDITERRHAEERIRELVSYDALTGLPNRKLFHDQFTRAIALAERLGRPLAVLQVNIDRFKRINETLGRSAGDRLLKEVAVRLTSSLRATDHVLRGDPAVARDGAARLGSDEFIVLASALSHVDDASKVARRVLSELARPIDLDGHEVVMTASIGIAIYPLDGYDVDTLLRNADTATAHAKERGRNNHQFFAESMNRAALATLTLENSLRKALERDQLAVHYQPKVDLVTGAIVGVEALLRWHHPELGMVSPARFIPLAEETGLIVPIGEWVLRTAAQQLAQWHASGYHALSVAVNMSAKNFGDARLTDLIDAALAQSGLDPKFLEIEVTESMLMHDVKETVRILTWFRGKGIRVSVDDFGTGYSSLAYLRRFPLDVLKIDRSFVQEATQNADAAAITTAIIAMAKSLHLEVIAEGVETEDQAIFLLDHGCRFVQGYLYGRPVPAPELLAMLAGVRRKAAVPKSAATLI